MSRGQTKIPASLHELIHEDKDKYAVYCVKTKQFESRMHPLHDICLRVLILSMIKKPARLCGMTFYVGVV